MSLPQIIPLANLADANVPCDGCTRCCESAEHVWLLDEEDYPVVEVVQGFRALGRIAGMCMYLTVNGCSIHGAQPMICRKFDCREPPSFGESRHPDVEARGQQLRSSSTSPQCKGLE